MTGKILRFFANQPSIGIWLTVDEAAYVDKRMLQQSKLPLDIYFSLIDPNYPHCF